MDFTPAIHTFLLTLGYTIFGMLIFGIAFWIIVKICPFSMRKEIEEDQNISLAILIGSVMLGLSIIIAATIHG
jgi:putative membrane protein